MREKAVPALLIKKIVSFLQYLNIGIAKCLN